MLHLKVTRNQVLNLMKDLPESHWFQNRLMNALAEDMGVNITNADDVKKTLNKNGKKNNQQKVTQERENAAHNTNRLLTKNDVKPVNSVYQRELDIEGKKFDVDNNVLCNFEEAWVGECRKATIRGTHNCPTHYKLQCSRCGDDAVLTCSKTYQLVCGATLCRKHQNSC